MSTSPRSAPSAPQGKRPQLRRVAIAAIARPTPRLRRITLTGEELAGFTREGGAGHVRVWIPNEDGELVLPGSPRVSEALSVERLSPSRAYTPRRWDAARRELDLDIVLHGQGPLATWAATARVGDELVVAGPRGEYSPAPDASRYLLAGDESAIPAIATLLELLPASVSATVLAEVGDASDELPLPGPTHVQIRWLHRGGQAAPGRLLQQTIREIMVPSQPGDRVWVACEAGALRSIRQHLLQERGFAPSAIQTRGYWKLGTSNHPDHDMGMD